MARILLVDHDPKMLRTTADMLTKGGYKTISAEFVKQALKKLEKDPTIALVISDVNMPKSGGLDLLKSMSHSPRLANIPVILCAFQGDPETLLKGMRAGARDFLVKPFDAEILLARVEKVILQGKLTVLLVEDERLVREKIGGIIERQGFTVVLCETAEDGLESLVKRKIDIIISDIGLPGMSGFAFIKLVKDRYSNIPVALITGLSVKYSGEIASRCGADGYITKPYMNSEIIRMLRDMERRFVSVSAG